MLEKKTAIVTGSTKGMGLAIAKSLLAHQYFVILNYAHDTDTAQAVEKSLSEQYQLDKDFCIIQQNLETQEDIDTFYESCLKVKNNFDVIVLNAGCTNRTKWNELTWSDWAHVMDVNVNAPAALIRKFDKNINNNGNLIFISSAMSIWPHATSVPYTVSKSAVNGLTKSLVKEYCDRNVRVNAVLPGFVNTPWQKKKPAAQKQRICDKVALHRFAEPEEIAEIVMSILNSSYINGALIQADGGYCYR